MNKLTEDEFIILRDITEKKEINEYAASELSKLLNKNLIENTSEKYSITEKGLLELGKYKVDNAVIMAAGFGSRFVPYTYHKPKGLLECNGEVMIERQIMQLHNAGIFDIVLIVGYLSNEFNYLEEKFGVKLIENPEYDTKNNISSLYYAHKSDEMKNTYILTSDVIYLSNVFHQYEYQSWYAMKYFSDETDEWVVKLNDNERIIDIATSGSKSYAMYGPAFFTNEFSVKLMELIHSIYQEESKAQYYWENVFWDNINVLSMFGQHYESDVVLEFESFDELVDYDESYINNPRSIEIEKICDFLNVKPNMLTAFKNISREEKSLAFEFICNELTYLYSEKNELSTISIVS